ncbi:hypothetical protein LPJ78_005543 [Coemansia sp. RSA 989]|nr:hypothetical protein BX667DRAFT_499334 [Coemansia mojavensis]KAJ1738659.1 hypothetical protein LPJ68_005371 [Coemansia sp. RSA 1086]KAJ1747089.1 hypothetical protein LPJ79_005502 [Coemansia sp. RSA 1821]KAJ1861071.1 hypothetical protein LPJ78_005543 [Coemansia sp. RSA 989]KAJ1869131.1 hypothetical protein LPJ55_005581 [Coemansia sp. RSA 990]KAJ2645898.1 hypothetical protein IWW40_005797 [Coemansia sp. RSA 1250]KAJ2667735.1 hypothetical protein IWW42_005729 [Coemansia sp. RSA 1085]
MLLSNSIATTVAIALLASFAHVYGAKVDTPAVKDSTILRSTVSCANCPESNCYKCTLGHENTLVANTGGLAFIQSLIGFHMPVAASQVTNCTVQIPAFTTRHENPLTVVVSQAASSDWNEDTVNGENAPASGSQIARVDVPAYANLGPVDITPACQSAINGEFSVYFGSGTGRYEFWSKDSGNPAILHITYNEA